MARPKSYKQINVNFNLENDIERKIYEYLSSKRGKGNYIKDLIEADMNGAVIISAPVEKVEVVEVEEKVEKVTIDTNVLDEYF